MCGKVELIFLPVILMLEARTTVDKNPHLSNQRHHNRDLWIGILVSIILHICVQSLDPRAVPHNSASTLRNPRYCFSHKFLSLRFEIVMKMNGIVLHRKTGGGSGGYYTSIFPGQPRQGLVGSQQIEKKEAPVLTLSILPF